MSTLPPIDSFSGPYRFLSNFWIEPDGTHVEGEYQAAKSVPPRDALRLLSPGQAKAAGRRSKLRRDWDHVRVGIMYNLVRQKFADHRVLAEALMATGDAELIEGNHWGDHFWGVCRGVGENRMGKILMEVRMKLVALEFGIEWPGD